jgi:hypothetical protein
MYAKIALFLYFVSLTNYSIKIIQLLKWIKL